MGVTGLMTMRATIERNETPGVDDYGQKGPPGWIIVGVDVPCYVWIDTKRRVVADQRTVIAETPMALVERDLDVVAEDRIRQVVDRRGNELFGTMYVDVVVRRRDHQELRLRAHG